MQTQLIFNSYDAAAGTDWCRIWAASCWPSPPAQLIQINPGHAAMEDQWRFWLSELPLYVPPPWTLQLYLCFRSSFLSSLSSSPKQHLHSQQCLHWHLCFFVSECVHVCIGMFMWAGVHTCVWVYKCRPEEYLLCPPCLLRQAFPCSRLGWLFREF